MTRNLLSIKGLSDRDLVAICRLATQPVEARVLAGRGVALVFERPSLRTRASSSTAVHDLGGFATFFGDEEIGLDSRESAEDVARTLAEMYPIAGLRVRHHATLERMVAATAGRMAVINLLSDAAHPTQAIADVLTIAERLTGGDVGALSGLEVAYVGDATNVTRSLAVALLRHGANVTVGAPEGYQLAPGGVEDPHSVFGGGRLRLTDSAADAVRGADVVYTDAWVSMGFEEETARRRADLAAFRIDAQLLTVAPSALVMHCLPAHRGDEVTDEVLDGERSVVWRQVFHRRSAMVGALRWISGEGT